MRDTLWITGIAGFTGSHLLRLVDALPERPRIVGLDLAEKGTDRIDAYYRVDLNDASEVERIARTDPPRWVVHLAGAVPPADEVRMWRCNVGATIGLLSGLTSLDRPNIRVVGIGSAAEYAPVIQRGIRETDPCCGSSLYGRVKWAQSMVTLGAGEHNPLATIVARPFNLIGPGLPPTLVAGWLCDQFAEKRNIKDIVVGNIDSARDFVDVRDAVKAYWMIAQCGRAGQIYNVCSEAPTPVREIIGLMVELTGRPRRVRVDPTRLRDSDPQVIYGDCSKLREETGWKPSIELVKSVSDMLAYVGRSCRVGC